MAGWGGLVPDVLFMIAKRLENVEDFVSFVSVCSTWRAVRLYEGSTQSLKPLRWLIFSSPIFSHRNHEFYSFTKDKIYRVELPENITKLRRAQIIVTNGWILILSRDPKMSLLHPFSHHVITLPPKTAYGVDLCDVRKAALSSSPFLSPNDYSLMIIFGKMCQLGFWKLGDKSWSVIETCNAPFEDVIYCKGQFYAIDKQGVIYVCDIRGCNSTIAVSINEIPLGLGDHSFYLARRTANQDLLIVSRCNSLWKSYHSEVSNKTSPFKVYEINLCGKGVERVNDLGAKTIFLSSDEAVCIENSKFPSGIVDPYHSRDNYSYNSSYWYTISSHPPKEGMHMRFCSLKEEKVKNFFYSLE